MSLVPSMEKEMKTCPKCGADRQARGWERYYQCGSHSVTDMHPFSQSDKCRVAELEAVIRAEVLHCRTMSNILHGEVPMCDIWLDKAKTLESVL